MSKNQELHDQLARAWGRLIDDAAACRGGNPRPRQIDLAVAATASVERVSLFTHNFATSASSKTSSRLAKPTGIREFNQVRRTRLPKHPGPYENPPERPVG